MVSNSLMTSSLSSGSSNSFGKPLVPWLKISIKGKNTHIHTHIIFIIRTINHNSHFYLRYFREYLCLLHWLQMISLPLAIYQPATSINGHYDPWMHHPPIFTTIFLIVSKEWLPWPWPLWPRIQCPLYNFRRCHDQQRDINPILPLGYWPHVIDQFKPQC